MSAGIVVRNLTLAYRRHPVVHHLSGEFAAGRSTAIVGPNGAGKSTLMKALAGLIVPDHGEIRFVGCTAKSLAYLPQQAAVERDFPLAVRDAVLLGDWRRSGWFGRAGHVARRLAEAALEAVGLAGFEDRNLDELSVGQFQRVQFARVMLQDAPLILLDEPFAALDAPTTDALLNLVDRWQQEGRTVIAVLHDTGQVRRHFGQTLLLAREAVAWGPTESVLCPENLSRAWQLGTAWDDAAPVCARDRALEAAER
jgi:zinc/manganese transport system ATP-binding protein